MIINCKIIFIVSCQSITTPKSSLKAYVENNFKIYLNDIGLLRALLKASSKIQKSL